uniref:Myb-like domain-containing protein n=1 Tax=Pithovirus LCPAC202 TaxID=2506592 RepID=A0A481Z648_9VIRU|nr:MAG: hypothetical protein LCPAC202_03370 [Pithovirus LCPAC202]
MKRKSPRKTQNKYQSPLKRRKMKLKKWSAEEKELLRACTNQIKQLGHRKYYWKRVSELFLQNTSSPKNHRTLISITTMGNRMKLGSGDKSKKWTKEEKDRLKICSIKVKEKDYQGNFWVNLAKTFGNSRSLHSIISIGGPMNMSPSNSKKPWTIQDKTRLTKCAKEIWKSNYTGNYWLHVSNLFGPSRTMEAIKKKGMEMKLNLVGLGKRWTKAEKKNLADCTAKVRLGGYTGNYWKNVSELFGKTRTVASVKYKGIEMKLNSKQDPIGIINQLDKGVKEKENEIILDDNYNIDM